MALRERLRNGLSGPHFVLPRPLDVAAEWWAARPPRVRMLLTVLALCAALFGMQSQIAQANRRWGGTPVPVWVAPRDLAVGIPPQPLTQVEFPPRVVPPGAVRDVPDDAVLAIALPAGAVLTQAHLDARGPAANLPADQRAVPVPVEVGWGLVAGGWVDVWVTSGVGNPAQLVARSRPVLEVREDSGTITALLGLAATEVAPVTAALALNAILVTHAPAPDPPAQATVAPPDGPTPAARSSPPER